MTRQNRFTPEGQKNIYTVSLRKTLREAEESGAVPDVRDYPLDISSPEDWMQAVRECAEELETMCEAAEAVMDAEDIISAAAVFHPELADPEREDCGTASFINDAAMHSENTLSVLTAEYLNIAEELAFLFRKSAGFTWKEVSPYADGFTEEMFRAAGELTALPEREAVMKMQSAAGTLSQKLPENGDGGYAAAAAVMLGITENSQTACNIITLKPKKKH